MSQNAANCILVVERRQLSQTEIEPQLVGIFTERDAVRVAISDIIPEETTIGAIATRQVLTLKQSEAENALAALHLLRKHQIRHLPIVGERGQLIGMITPQSIRQLLQPTDLMQVKQVATVMTASIARAPSSASVLDLAKQMAARKISCVVITEPTNDAAARPIGIVTERDIVQFQVLGLDLASTKAQTVMSSPLFPIKPDDSLWDAHERMQQHGVRRLVVTGDDGELVGIVTQTTLLQVLNPIDMYDVVDALQKSVEEQTAELRQANAHLQREIEQRQQLAKSLAESETRYRTVVEQQTELVCRFLPNGTLTFVNEAYCRYFGKQRRELIGHNFINLIPEESQKTVEAHLGSLNRETPTGMIEYSAIAADGEVRWQQWSNIALFNESGRLVEFQSVGRDITERRRIERELRKSQSRLAGILDIANDAIISIDKWQRITMFNKGAEQIFGYTAVEAIGQSLEMLLPERFAAVHCQHVNDFRQSFSTARKMGNRRELYGRRKDGTEFPAEASISKFESENETILTVILRDITERKQVEERLRQVNEQLTTKVDELKQRHQEMVRLGEMNEFLQACLSVEEAYKAIADLLQPLFPNCSGGLFIVNLSNDLAEAVAVWGTPATSEPLFAPNECWALRRGRSHWVQQANSSLFCKHIDRQPLPASSLCIPTIAQGETLGLLYLSGTRPGNLTEAKYNLAVTVAEQIALALANLKLRETLHNQSIRDPLTGLFNRRYLEQSLQREILNASKERQPLSIIMLDVDRFKHFNDSFGHDAGDTVLRELAIFLQTNLRGAEIACRYGGEELTLILPQTELEGATKRAEQLREGVKNLSLQHCGQPLGTMTLSLGVACFPEHGTKGDIVMQAADAALYRAKSRGRDRVEIARI